MTKILYTSDLHGSSLCFRKFLSAGKIFKADVLIIGGDLTGKAIVPIIEQPNGSYKAFFFDKTHIANTNEELEKLKSTIADSGLYPYITASIQNFEDIANNEKKFEKLFSSLMSTRIQEWIKLFEEHYKSSNVKFFLLPGNDDSFDIDSVINESKCVINPEGKVCWIDDYHEMISTGYANITPWNCPRDVSEDTLAEKIENMVSKIENLENSIFNFHCPPYNTKLDIAPKLDENLQIVLEGGQIVSEHVGSVAIYNSIKKYQPLLGLHGHIHESRAFQRIGRTLCINPGSGYTEGTLHYAFINLDKESVKSFSVNIG